jgi:4-hydroxybenzoate polyprenyltransferase
MYLNDAFDADFDALHRRERPIPSGAISGKTVWRVGVVLLLAGSLCLVTLGFTTAILALLLCACIVMYDAIHKLFSFSPVLMALCRVLLYLCAASAAHAGITGLAAWSALALGFYVAGLSFLARKETTHMRIEVWPQLLLVVPVLLAWLVNDGAFREHALLIGAVVVLWSARSLRQVWMQPRNVPGAVSGLLAGIVWVDLLAVVDEASVIALAFVALFLLAIAFQRFVPAT